MIYLITDNLAAIGDKQCEDPMKVVVVGSEPEEHAPKFDGTESVSVICPIPELSSLQEEEHCHCE